MGINKDNSVLISGRGLRKEYRPGKAASLMVLKGIDIDVHQHEILVIVGPSGAGKSTLLHILGGLDKSTGGELRVLGQSLSDMTEEELSIFRNQNMGFVFQFHHLLPEFTAVENVALPLMVRGEPKGNAFAKARERLAELGLESRYSHKPSELSGGEQQRVAMCRAMINDPSIIIADEPTGNLDEANGRTLHNMFLELASQKRATFIIATHNAELASMASRVIRLVDGLQTTE